MDKTIKKLNDRIDNMIISGRTECPVFKKLIKMHKNLTRPTMRVINKRSIFNTNFTIKTI